MLRAVEVVNKFECSNSAVTVATRKSNFRILALMLVDLAQSSGLEDQVNVYGREAQGAGGSKVAKPARAGLRWRALAAMGLGFGSLLSCDSNVEGMMAPTNNGMAVLPSLPGGASGNDATGGDSGGSGESHGAGGAPGTGGTRQVEDGGAGGELVAGGAGGSPADLCAEVYATASDPAELCLPVESAEHLPGRVLPPVQDTVTRTVSLQDVYEKFEGPCGRCHVDQDPGDSNGSMVLLDAAAMLAEERIGERAIELIETTSADEVMPPSRDPAATIPAAQRELVEMLRAWLAAGRTNRGFERTATVSTDSVFRDPDALRDGMTNIGDCIPEPELVGCAEGEMQRLDAKFAAMRSFASLPKVLEETDLFRLDSELLAQRGVISYAPTYTLFSDNAKKMRYVRVPVGKSIRYVTEETKTEECPVVDDLCIPDNTRFYKTFLRRVVGKDGRPSYRKVETRIIVARRDGVENGEIVHKAIFGTYLWSLDEARAELLEDPYDDGTPFRDAPLRHVIDEQRAETRIDRVTLAPLAAIDPDTFDGIAEASAEDQLLREEEPQIWHGEADLLTRGYAVPGRDRCVQCHMGSSSQSFILGFNQYQVDRRKQDEGGVFDGPVAGDELTQLERLVEYGLITDLPEREPDATAVFQLEKSQGDRDARNDYEIDAQAYMMGNCAFCHNPRGFPSVENPSLREIMSFYPRAEGQHGIFQFSLETMSPRTARTPAFDVRMPYITPSLFERDARNRKFFPFGNIQVEIVAPWRSLLYRNVHTPFTYSNDEAMHPHMPLNVPGYDPRAARIMGSWMLSIPARLKPLVVNRAEPLCILSNGDEFLCADGTEGPARAEWEAAHGEPEQPWVEVQPADPSYAQYVEAANLRRRAFLGEIGETPQSPAPRLTMYADYSAACPPGIAKDCLDAYATEGLRAYLGGSVFVPDTSDVFATEMAMREQPFDGPRFLAPPPPTVSGRPLQVVASPAMLESDEWRRGGGSIPVDGVPDRAHWIDRDLTATVGEWRPRRPQWESVFASRSAFIPSEPDLAALSEQERTQVRQRHEIRKANAERVYDLLPNFGFSKELEDFAATARPYGLWKAPDASRVGGDPPTCAAALRDAPSVAKVATETGSPLWFAQAGIDPEEDEAASRKVYMQRSGESMFNLICSNCHGSAADADSLLAGTILELTGGRTRVANLRDGLFGAHGQNRAAEFGDEDLALRYLVWMGLGGTEATIPKVVLNRVGATQPLGVPRDDNPNAGNAQATANMLDNAVGFCKDSIGLGLSFDNPAAGPGFPEYDGVKGRAAFDAPSSLVAQNGDAELWVAICSLNNPPPIRAIRFTGASGVEARFKVETAYWRDLDGRLQFPPTARFGDERGRISMGIRQDNLMPWCIVEPLAADRGKLELEWIRAGYEDEPVPYCPSSLSTQTSSNGIGLLEVAPLRDPDRRRDLWAMRGAMNVGASVFKYLDALSKGEIKPTPAYDACTLDAPTTP